MRGRREGEFADKFNTMPKYVVSSTLENPQWNNTTVLKGDVVEEASSLKEQIDGIVQTPGSLRPCGRCWSTISPTSAT